MVRAAIVGSILANVLLVLGAAFFAGGIKHGTQKFGTEAARRVSLLMLLSVAALLIPSLTHALHTPADGHERALSVIVSIVLLIIFAAQLPAALKQESADEAEAPEEGGGEWGLPLALGVLAAAGVATAFVSDWFVEALTPAMDSMNISEAFAGLVIVAIAGNAVENVVGIQLALKNRADTALTVIIQSPVQIALVIAPVAVLAAPLVGATFTLVLSPLLIAVLVVAVLITVVVVLDGESNWLEGLCLMGLYALIATSFWWG